MLITEIHATTMEVDVKKEDVKAGRYFKLRHGRGVVDSSNEALANESERVLYRVFELSHPLAKEPFKVSIRDDQKDTIGKLAAVDSCLYNAKVEKEVREKINERLESALAELDRRIGGMGFWGRIKWAMGMGPGPRKPNV